MAHGLTDSIWPNTPLPNELAPAATVCVWVYPQLVEVTADTQEQALMLALSQWVQLRWGGDTWMPPDPVPGMTWQGAVQPLGWAVALLLGLLLL